MRAPKTIKTWFARTNAITLSCTSIELNRAIPIATAAAGHTGTAKSPQYQEIKHLYEQASACGAVDPGL